MLRSLTIAGFLSFLVQPAFGLSLEITTSGGGSWTYSAAQLGCTESGGVFHCSSEGIDTSQGPYQTAFWSMDEWNFSSDADPFINGNVAVTNPMAGTQSFTLTFTQATGSFGPNNVMGGSVAGSITGDAGGGTVSAPIGGALYAALIDGGTVATLHDDPFSVSVGAFLSGSIAPADFGTPIPSLPAPDVTTSIGLQLAFDLTAGDQASLTSVFVVETPEAASGGLLLLGVVAWASRRRR